MLLNVTVLIFPNLDPVAIQLGPLAIRWYALAYLAGIIGGVWLIKRIMAQPTPRFPAPLLNKDSLDDLLFYATLGIVIGGRLGRVLFYDFSDYFITGARPLLDIVKIWQGGMAFHGGVIGVVVAMLLLCRKYKIPFLALMDVVAAATPLGLFFGRLANFANGELWGKPASVAWAVIFPHPAAGGIPRHPSQLYEAATEGLLLLAILLPCAFIPRLRDRSGLLCGLFLVGYASARTFCEMFREPDGVNVFLNGLITLSQGQTLSLPMALLGLFLIVYSGRKTA